MNNEIKLKANLTPKYFANSLTVKRLFMTHPPFLLTFTSKKFKKRVYYNHTLAAEMRQTNCVKLSKLVLPLILLVTACQATSLPNKSTTHTSCGLSHQSKHSYPILDAISDYVVADVENTVVFKGNVELKRDQLIRFLGDYISFECNENGLTYVVEMKGNVSMWKSTALNIKSEKAESLDFRVYIDFIGNVSISNKGYRDKTDWVRYYFLQEKLQFKWTD